MGSTDAANVTGRRRRTAAGPAAAWLLVTTLLAAGCGSGGAPHRALGARLVVATGLYPLAQAAEQIGDGRAVTDDVVPAGEDPLSYRPDAGAAAAVSNSALVLLGPEGLQPQIDGLAAGSRPGHTVVHLAPASGGAYFWLDPHSMRQVLPAIAAAMEAADPPDAATFREGARAFEDALGSTDIDYQSTLSTCPRRDVFAPDLSFAHVAATYGLAFHAIGTAEPPPSGTVKSAAAAVSEAGATTIFEETWVPDATVRAVAAAAGVKVRRLDTLIGPPPGGWPRQATYLNLLEANLGALSSALGCPDMGAGA